MFKVTAFKVFLLLWSIFLKKESFEPNIEEGNSRDDLET